MDRQKSVDPAKGIKAVALGYASPVVVRVAVLLSKNTPIRKPGASLV